MNTEIVRKFFIQLMLGMFLVAATFAFTSEGLTSLPVMEMADGCDDDDDDEDDDDDDSDSMPEDIKA